METFPLRAHIALLRRTYNLAHQRPLPACVRVRRHAWHPAYRHEGTKGTRRSISSTAVLFAKSGNAPQRLDTAYRTVQSLHSSLVAPSSVPEEKTVLNALQTYERTARMLVDDDKNIARKSTDSSKETTATSALLGTINTRNSAPSINAARLAEVLSWSAYEIIKSPGVFITPAILKSYVSLQALLGQPSTFPEVFTLYANKPIPKPNIPAAKFTTPNPHKASAAVSSNVANAALDTAITAHDLPLALSIIETTFRTTAFRRSKILRQAYPPLLGLGLAPLAAWTLATQFSSMQSSMDPAMATQIAFAGILTYVGAVAMVGFVAVTTANDQMDRVTWATGMPLRERWLREEERAAADRIAGVWGFKEIWKRGEEEGEDWEALREWIGLRGMILDRVSLMEGME
ncbi:hypothetical protein LTR66_012754 [Elasticomyces elasticus]|nr:hypothetical protein LTR66_012754 [Elasticomyces elasticus]